MLIMTVADALTITSGGPTQTHMSVMRAASRPPMMTLGEHGPEIGPPTCGTGGVPGVAIGQRCMSVIRAAGMPMGLTRPAKFSAGQCKRRRALGHEFS